MRDILLLSLTLVCSFVALGRPFVGLLAFVFYALFAPQTWVWFMARELPHQQIISGCTLLGYLVSSERKTFLHQREAKLMGVLWIFFAITSFFAVERQPAL